MNDLASIQKADRQLLLSLEEPINDLRNIAGILLDLTNEKFSEKAGDVTFSESDAEQIYFMICLGLRTAIALRRRYYGEVGAS